MEIFRFFGSILIKDHQAKQSLRDIDNQAKGVGGSIAAIAKRVGGMIAAFTGVQIGIGIFRDMASAAMDSERATKRLDTLMRNVPGTTDQAIESIREYSDELAEVTTISDDVIEAGASQLATFQLQASSIKSLLPALEDLAIAAYGVTVRQDQMQQMGNLLGKVMMGQVGALAEYGVSLTEAQAELLRTGSETVKVSTLIEVLRQNFGGLAKGMAATSEGGLRKFLNNLREFFELGSKFVMPLFNTGVNLLNKLVGGANTLLSALTGHKKTVYDLAKEYKELNEKASLTIDEKKRLKEVTYELARTFPGVIDKINSETGALKLNNEALWDNIQARQMSQIFKETQFKLETVSSDIQNLEKENEVLKSTVKWGKNATEQINSLKYELLEILHNKGVDLKKVLGVNTLKEAIDAFTQESMKLPQIQAAYSSMTEKEKESFNYFNNLFLNDAERAGKINQQIKEKENLIKNLKAQFEELQEVMQKIGETNRGKLTLEEFMKWYKGASEIPKNLNSTAQQTGQAVKATREQYSELTQAVEKYLKVRNQERKEKAIQSGDLDLLPNLDTKIADLKTMKKMLDEFGNGQSVANLSKLLGIDPAALNKIPRSAFKDVASSLNEEIIDATIEKVQNQKSIEEQARKEIDNILKQASQERLNLIQDEQERESQLLEMEYQEQLEQAGKNEQLKTAIKDLYSQKRLTLQQKYMEKELAAVVEFNLQQKELEESYDKQLQELNIQAITDAREQELAELDSWYNEELQKKAQSVEAINKLTELYDKKRLAINKKYEEQEEKEREEVWQRQIDLQADYLQQITEIRLQSIADGKTRELALLDQWYSDELKKSQLNEDTKAKLKELYLLKQAEIEKKYREEALKEEEEFLKNQRQIQSDYLKQITEIRINSISNEYEREIEKLNQWYSEEQAGKQMNEESKLQLDQLYAEKQAELARQCMEEKMNLENNRIEYEFQIGKISTAQYLEYLRYKLSLTEEYTDEYISLLNKINALENANLEELKGSWKDATGSIINTTAQFLNDSLFAIFDKSSRWEDRLKSFRQGVANIFKGLAGDIIKALLKAVIYQEAWLTVTLGNIAKAVTAFIAQAYTGLLAFYSFLGPAAPFAAGATIAAGLAALAVLGYKAAKFVAPGIGSFFGGGEKEERGQDSRIVNLSGSARDSMAEMFRPLQEISVLSNYAQNLTEAVFEIRDMMRGTGENGAGASALSSAENTGRSSEVFVDTVNISPQFNTFTDFKRMLKEAGEMGRRTARLGGVRS